MTLADSRPRTRADPPRPGGRRGGLRRTVSVLLRLAVVVGLYVAYAYARDLHGLDAGPAGLERATRHARTVSGLLPLPDERAVQQPLLAHPLLLRATGAYYGSAHFAVTLLALVWLGVRRPQRFDRLGLVLALSTAVAVLVFVLYPVAPPRLFPPGEGTVDTLAAVGGLWSYDHGFLERISDPFAAMPSLHLDWAVWVALVLRLSGLRAVRVAAPIYPLLTFAAVIVTGNHWWEDAVAGAALPLLLAAVLARPWRASTTGSGHTQTTSAHPGRT